MVKNPPANAGDIRDAGLISGLGKYSEEGNGNPLQYACLEKSHGPRNTVGIGSQKVGQDGKQLSSSTGRREEQINSDSPESAELQGRVAWGVLETRWKGPLLLETA